MPVSSARTCTCSVLRKGWRRCFAQRLTPAQVLRLNDGQFVTFAQTVDGFPPANRAVAHALSLVAGRRNIK